jgi:predicted RNA-binding protein associated with RNAse of E/G family
MAPAHAGRWLRIPQDHFALAERRYDEAHVLSFAWPETPYAVLLFFRPDWTTWSWYVNLQDPPERSAVGFNTMDHELDVIVELDGSWRWKDEDELAEAIRRGVIAPEDEWRLRTDGERAVRRILHGEPPFDRDWSTWRPDPSWPAPELPPGWDRI